MDYGSFQPFTVSTGNNPVVLFAKGINVRGTVAALNPAGGLVAIENAMKLDAKPSDKAIALCWIGHLVGDYHQPCHTGPIYCKEFLTMEGDRRANLIQTVQSKNLHAVWDQQVGRRFDLSDVKRRAFEIDQIQERGNTGDVNAAPAVWASEIKHVSGVYTKEVLEWVKGDRTQPLELSESYLRMAGSVAQIRAKKAAQRLAVIWSESL